MELVDEGLDAALSDAATVSDQQLDSDEVRVAISALVAARKPRAPRSHGRARKVAGVTVALLVVGAGAAAAGGFPVLHTGMFGLPGMTENDTSEYLNPASPDVVALLDSYAKETPLAPGYSLAPDIARVQNVGALMQSDGLRGSVALFSACTWEQSWVRAHTSGDTKAEAVALAALRAVPSWPVMARIDGDGRLVPSYQAIADAAAAGDVPTVAHQLSINCDLGQ